MTDTTDTAPLGAEAQWLLAELERLEKEATPRPWRVEEKAILGPDIDGLESVVWDERSWARGEHYSPTKTQAVANAKIATNLRNHLPQILTALRSLAEMREVLGKKLSDKTRLRLEEFAEVCEHGPKEDRELGIAIGHLLRWHDQARAVLSKTQERKG